MSAQPNDLRTDVDSQETREWMDALSAVINACLLYTSDAADE